MVSFGHFDDILQWVQLLDEKGTETLRHLTYHSEFYRRFLLALLRPHFPYLALDLVQSFNDINSSSKYPICRHLKYSNDPGFFCAPTPFGLIAPLSPCVTFSALLRRGVATQISRLLSIHAAQDLGFVRLARMCQLEQNSLFGTTVHVISDVGAFWNCHVCAFPNEDTEALICGACGWQNKGRAQYQWDDGNLLVDELTTAEALKQMRKLTKKLKQVGYALRLFHYAPCAA
jgi:hypothetical protein